MSANSANTLVIRHARAITLAGDAGVRKGPAMSQLAEITDAALVCRDDKLVWVGPDSDLPAKLVADAIELDVAGACVLPGFVDSHTHVVWGGSRKDEMEISLRRATASS